MANAGRGAISRWVTVSVAENFAGSHPFRISFLFRCRTRKVMTQLIAAMEAFMRKRLGKKLNFSAEDLEG